MSSFLISSTTSRPSRSAATVDQSVPDWPDAPTVARRRPSSRTAGCSSSTMGFHPSRGSSAGDTGSPPLVPCCRRLSRRSEDRQPHSLGRLVLTSCDGLRNGPRPMTCRYVGRPVVIGNIQRQRRERRGQKQMTGNFVVSSRCGTINRLPPSRPAIDAECGRCRPGFSPGVRMTLLQKSSNAVRAQHDTCSGGCRAPWCGPCRMMAPAYEAAAGELELQAPLMNEHVSPGGVMWFEVAPTC